MRRLAWLVTATVLTLGGGMAALGGRGDTPIGPRWWPTEWGPDDQQGAGNRLTPARVLEANRLIRSGRIYSLGRVYEEGMPLAGKRHFALTIPGSPTDPPQGENQVLSHDEMFSGEIGQVGTQLDGLGHVGVRLPDDDYFYNGFRRSRFATARGLTKLGIENVPPFFTRGVLLDVARHKGLERLPAGYVITARDLEETAAAASQEIRPGDAVFLRTGHGTLWMKDNKAYGESEPGIGMDAGRWLAARKIVLCGADNWAIEAVPAQNEKRPFEVHQLLLVRHGIYLLENLDLEELARDRAYEFAFIFAPLRLKGATGSPGNPIAVR
jgi:kynurenine formamidase